MNTCGTATRFPHCSGVIRSVLICAMRVRFKIPEPTSLVLDKRTAYEFGVRVSYERTDISGSIDHIGGTIHGTKTSCHESTDATQIYTPARECGACLFKWNLSCDAFSPIGFPTTGTQFARF